MLLPLLYAVQVWGREHGAVRGVDVAVFVLVYLLPAAWLWALAAVRKKHTTAFTAIGAMALLLYWDGWARQPWLAAHVPYFGVWPVTIGLAIGLLLGLAVSLFITPRPAASVGVPRPEPLTRPAL